MDYHCRNAKILSQIQRLWVSGSGPVRKLATSGLQTSFCMTERGLKAEMTWVNEHLRDRWGCEGDPKAPVPPAQPHSQGLSSEIEGFQWKLKKSLSWGNLWDTKHTQCCFRAQGTKCDTKRQKQATFQFCEETAGAGCEEVCKDHRATWRLEQENASGWGSISPCQDPGSQTQEGWTHRPPLSHGSGLLWQTKGSKMEWGSLLCS